MNELTIFFSLFFTITVITGEKVHLKKNRKERKKGGPICLHLVRWKDNIDLPVRVCGGGAGGSWLLSIDTIDRKICPLDNNMLKIIDRYDGKRSLNY